LEPDDGAVASVLAVAGDFEGSDRKMMVEKSESPVDRW
jgi:hypothetical protein